MEVQCGFGACVVMVELSCVEGIEVGELEEDGLACGFGEGGCLFAVLDGFAHEREGLAQGVPGGFVGAFGPKEAGEAGAFVGAAVFYGEVSEQGTDADGGDQDGIAFESGRKWTQEAQCKAFFHLPPVRWLLCLVRVVG